MNLSQDQRCSKEYTENTKTAFFMMTVILNMNDKTESNHPDNMNNGL